MFSTGYVIAIIGIALCVVLCGVGSGIGLYKTATATAGVLGENPNKFGKLIILMLLPATQGLYGFLIAIIASSTKLTPLYDAAAAATELTAGSVTAQGWAIFAACLPMAISGFVSAFFQAKAAVNCIYAAAKQDSLGFKIAMGPAMIEFYALLGLVISILVILAI